MASGIVLEPVKAEGFAKRVDQLADPAPAVDDEGSAVHRTLELQKIGASLLKVVEAPQSGSQCDARASRASSLPRSFARARGVGSRLRLRMRLWRAGL